MIFLFGAFIFIVVQGVFAGMETGMVSLRRPRVEHAAKSGSPTAKILMFFVANPSKMIATTLLGVNVGVVCSSLMAKKFMESLGLGHGYGLLASTCVMSVLLLSCEIVPKNWFRQAPFERCSLFAYLLYGAYWAMAIPVKAFSAVTDRLSGLMAKGQSAHGARPAPLMMEDLRLFLRESESDGVIEPEACSILDNAIDFHSMKVDSIKIPRSDVKDLASSASIQEAFELCKANSFSRIPVYAQQASASDPKRRWIGIFSVYDAIFSMPEELWKSTAVASCLRPAQEIDGASGMGEMLERARRSKVPLFIVSSASAKGGGAEQTGIVTPEDVARRLFE